MMTLPQKDVNRLRTLAAAQRALAESPAMRTLQADWRKHGAFAPDARPMVRIEVGPFAQEAITPQLLCEHEAARAIEFRLLMHTAAHVLLGDDTVVEDFYAVPLKTTFIPFGLPPRRQETGGVGHRQIPYIHDLEADFAKLGKSVFTIDRLDTEREADAADALFGDLLPVRIRGASPRISPWKDIVLIMDMEDLFTALYDYEELYHEMMRRLIGDHMERLDALEAAGALYPTTDSQYLFQGSYCYTDALPQERAVSTRDIWGYMDAQEASSVSPAMFKTHLLPYYRQVAERFGHLSYGCCEPVHGLWANCLDQFANLRKVSISPWCDEVFMGNVLRGRKVVFLKKPPSNFLGVGNVLNEAAVSAHFDATVQAAHHCALEIVQRDVYGLHGPLEKARRYITLIRRCVERHER